MFFSWFTKNKHFNKKRGISGQIMPFLLVIIAIFLGAAMTVVKLGRDVINITCTENSMDDCSLDAASIWSQALNEMMAANEEWKVGYDEFFAQLKDILTQRKQALDKAKDYIEKTKEAISSSNFGRVAIEPDCQVWDIANDVRDKFWEAQAYAIMAYQQLFINDESATGLAVAARTGVLEMKIGQQAAYYGFREGFAEAHAAAQEAGATIAQLNIEECLIQYPDGSTETDGGIIGESYTTTSVYVPNISSYQLQVSQRSAPCPYRADINPFPPELTGCDYPSSAEPEPPPEEDPTQPTTPLYENLGVGIDDMMPYALQATAEFGMVLFEIGGYLACAAVEMEDIYRETSGKPPGDCCPITGSVYQDSIGCPREEVAFNNFSGFKYSTEWWEAMRTRAAKVMNDILRLLEVLNTIADFMPSLIEHNQKIMDAFDPANKKVISSASGGEQNGLYDGWTGDDFMRAPDGAAVPPIIPGSGDTGEAVIIGIDSLTFEPGCISCSGGGQSSGAGYGGGSMADDGTGSYTPGLNDYCPSAEWGSGGTSGTAEDGGC